MYKNKEKEIRTVENKKTIPVYLVLVLLFVGIGVIFVPRIGDLTAAKTDVSKKVLTHYETQLVNLNLKTIDGKTLNKTQLKKGLVILNFWASWCQPCLEEFPSLVKLNNRFKDKDFLVVAINSDEDQADMNIKKTVKKYELNFPIVKDNNAEITDAYMISAIPVSIIYYDGKVIEVSKGKKDFYAEEFIDKVEKLTK